MHNLPKKLKQLREQHGHTQETTAQLLHTTRQCISNWENDKSTPDVASIKRFCTHYHTTPNELIGYTNTETQEMRDLKEMNQYFQVQNQHFQNFQQHFQTYQTQLQKVQNKLNQTHNAARTLLVLNLPLALFMLLHFFTKH